MRKEHKLLVVIALSSLLIALSLAVLFFVLHMNVSLSTLIFIIMMGLVLLVYYYLVNWWKKDHEYVDHNLNNSFNDALKLAKVGIVVYDDELTIKYMSSFFKERQIECTNQKLLAWLSELSDLLKGDEDNLEVIINGAKYEVFKKEDANVLLFKDINDYYALESNYKENALVLGIINFDNYDEVRELSEETAISVSEIRTPVYSYLKEFNVTYKTLRNNRLYLLLNEKIYEDLAKDRFSILNTVRKEAKRLDIPISLSMAFARGNTNLKELDEEVLRLIDIAQTRGGDQVVVLKQGEDAQFFGGSSEAREKSSKVKVRVMANSLKDLIVRSDKVIIVGHKEMDADCVGAMLCLSSIVQGFKKEAYCVAKSGGVEMTVKSILERYKNEIEERHHLVTVNEASNHLGENTLVVMVDHHSASQSNGEELLNRAKRIAIVDHHRRKADLDVKPSYVYIEASASSTCELMSEFLPYLSKRQAINQIEANIMYLGILIDTNRFRVRTNARTFDAASALRKYGADVALVEELNEEAYDTIVKRSYIINHSVLYQEGILISTLEEGIFNRTQISQACDQMLQTKGVRGVFVIAKISNEECAISARSKGDFNVQVIMEKMHGGGHMTAAGLQVKDQTILELKEALLEAISSYIKEKS